MAKQISFFKNPLFLKPKPIRERAFQKSNNKSLLASGPLFKDSAHQRSKRLTLKESLPVALR